MSTKKLTILVTSVSTVGHVNACSGALAPFLRHGHRVIFVAEEAYRGKLAKLGFEEALYEAPKDPKKEANPGEAFSQLLNKFKVFGNHSVEDKFVSLMEIHHSPAYNAEISVTDRKIKEAIEEFKPDLLWWDGGFLFPSVYFSGVPWVNNQSLVSTSWLYNDKVAPGCSGFSKDTDPKRVAAFNELRKGLTYSKRYNDFIESLGYERFPEDITIPQTQILTVYASPEEINYECVRSQKGWFNLEVFNKGSAVNTADEANQLKNFVPEDFLADTLNGQFSGKLVYLSMGSMGSFDIGLMRRFVNILATTKHKIIVSKGPRHEEFSLAANMWGERYLPQTSILPHVDLVITHGGNNTTTEVFAQGKPMVVLPMFGDQFDNAQRLEETGLGRRIDYDFTAEQLTGAIDSLLNDRELNSKLKAASKRILGEDRHELLVKTVEKLLSV